MITLKISVKGLIMSLTKQQIEYLEKAPNWEDEQIKHLQDPDYQRSWLELTLNEFLEEGNIETFIRCLTYVVKARIKSSGRGEISRLARELNIDRSNLSEIVNGNKQPRLETAFKLLNGLGYKYDIKLQSA